MLDVFAEISIIIVIATVVAGLMRLLKQPLIIGYIFTGLILSPFFLNVIQSTVTISIFSQIGIAFLLFIVGLSLTPKVIKEVGKISLITGIGQVVFTSLIGFFIAKFLGFPVIVSIYIAIALTFSSTIIIMKLLSDRNDLDKLYGKISIGFLLVQDIIAIFILIIISSFSSGDAMGISLLYLFLKGIALIVIVVLVSIYILPKLSDFFARSQEFLFLFSIAWGLGLATLFHYVGFSVEIGALVAGVALSVSPFHYEISSKMKPLRDFFIILFFISLGSQLGVESVGKYVIPAIIFSLFILIGNPLIVLVLMGLLNYNKKTSFQAGLTVAQISEFSLILIAMGVKVGHLTNDILVLVTIVGLITITGSTYFILYSDRLYLYLAKYLSVFERKGSKKRFKDLKATDIILFGYNRIGYDFLQSFRKLKKEFLVVDYNPDVIEMLTSKKINCIYGDAGDGEFLSSLGLKSIKMTISTIPDFETNLLLIEKIRRVNKNAIIMVVSHHLDEADVLYKEGATYVILPHFLGGKYASMLINKHGLNFKKFLTERDKHIKHLKERRELGHTHPNVEKNK
ncbi:MAG: cation:proton antiporter [Nanoarchaeota archaeon]|nr:cation:proton antiporter [Nanoarchaeota archaeon]